MLSLFLPISVQKNYPCSSVSVSKKLFYRTEVCQKMDKQPTTSQLSK